MQVGELIASITTFAHHSPFILVKWSLMLCLLFVLSILFYTENDKLNRHTPSQKNALFESAFTLAKKRGRYAILCFSLYIMTVLTYDIALYTRLNKESQPSVATEQSNKSTPLISNKQVTSGQAKIATIAPKNDVISLFDNVTVFDENNGQSKSAMDQMKQRFEPLLITYFILDHCKQSSEESFIILQDRILDDLSKIGGNSINLTRFVDAARGSFEEMYSGYDCANPALSGTKTNFENTIKGFQKPEN